MPNKFDPISKPLQKAKPCIVELLRDDGTIEWYEDCKAGQLFGIHSGRDKHHLNLDFHKINNFTYDTPEHQLIEAKKIINEIESAKKQEAEENKKLLEQVQLDIVTEKDTIKLKKKLEKIRGKYINLASRKMKNMGTTNRPVMGFVCYEKEFNPLPNDNVVHDAKQVTLWMETIRKNYKDFFVQRAAAINGVLVTIGIIVVAIIFVLARWGGDWFAPKEAVKTAENVAKLPLLLPLIPYNYKRLIKWLKR